MAFIAKFYTLLCIGGGAVLGYWIRIGVEKLRK